MTCGVILSGGLSRRFQVPGEAWVDKALYPINDRPMIRWVFDSLRPVVDSVIIAVNGWDRAARYREVIPEAVYVVDNELFRGPLAGIYSGVRACADDYVVVVPNDMPFIGSEAIGLMIDGLRHFDAVTYVMPNGHIGNALMALRRDSVIKILELLAGFGRNKPFDIFRGVPRALFLNPIVHGLDVGSFVNINTRDDLARKIEVGEVVVDGDVSLVRGFTIDDVANSRFDRLVGSLWYTITTGDYMPEFRLYAEAGLHMLAAHTLLDSRNERVKALGRKILQTLGIEKA